MLEPGSVGEVQGAVRESRAAGGRLRVVGTRSVERFGLQPQAERWDLVSTLRLEWIEVAERDFTVRVGAGGRLADLDAALAPLGMVWPVQRLEAAGTVGGLIASGRGTTITPQDWPARRWVLGARLVDSEGEVLTMGGATVKNSVGYGVTHALWGSEGRLGAIVELTLRVRRRRAADRAAGQPLERGALEAAAALVRCDELAPSTVDAAVAGLSGATQAACASDNSRVVGCYAERNTAASAAAALRAQGIEARVEPDRSTRKGSEAIEIARSALAPDGVFI